MNKKKICTIAIVTIVAIIAIILSVKVFANKKYEVTFKDGNKSLYTETTKGSVKKPVEPKREGYKFIGWYLENKPFNFNNKVNKNTILEARWEKLGKKYKVTFDYDNGSEKKEEEVSLRVIKPSDPVKEGYKFIGWYQNDELYDFNKEVTSNVELKARWEEVKEEKSTHNKQESNKNHNNKPSQKTPVPAKPTPKVEADTVKPTITNLSATSTTCEITVSLSGTDDKTSANELVKQYSLDGHNYTNSNYFGNLRAGKTYTVYARLIDKAGNITVQTRPVDTNIVPTPNNPAQNPTSLTNGSVTLTFAQSQYQLQYSLDGENFIDRYDINVTVAQNGRYYFRYKDKAGNVSPRMFCDITNIQRP